MNTHRVALNDIGSHPEERTRRHPGLQCEVRDR